MAETTIRIDDRPLIKFIRQVDGARGSGSPGATNPFEAMYRQWAQRYATAMKRRFIAQGDGQWTPLAASTLRARRSGTRRLKRGRRNPRSAVTTTRGGATAATAKILRDTGVLLRALDIRAVGNLTKRIPAGIRYGFGGPARHSSGGPTIRELAEIHQQGKGRVPARPILASPPAAVIRGFLIDLKRAVDRRR